MKTLIVAVNSKYIHSALAPWYLKAACGDECGEVVVREFTINDSGDSVLMKIYGERPDVAAFSCYIWNISFVLKLASNLKKLLPEIQILLGGPEISYSAADDLSSLPFVEYILAGEGEVSLPQLLTYIKNSRECPGNSGTKEKILGLTYRDEMGGICSNPAVGLDAEDIPSPYTEEMLGKLGNRIVYYEASRGCPFSCSYCLSSVSKGVRFLPMERVKKELIQLAGSGVRQIKFVDRTFNCNQTRAAEIFRFILQEFTDEDGRAKLNFHFEAAADLFDDALIDILAGAPEGLIQLEIGVQTVNTATLEAIHRKTDLDKLFEHFERLRIPGNIHLHLDLIAGLPFEDYTSFAESFNRVHAARPHQLQLGFLKLLKGSELRERHQEFGIVFREEPPYEILSGKWIGFEELSMLKGIEDLVDRYYNSGRFAKSLDLLIESGGGKAFDFYEAFLQFYQEKGLDRSPVAMKDLYGVMGEFARTVLDEESQMQLLERMRFDFLASDSSGSLPPSIARETAPGFKEKCFEFLKSEENLARYLPAYCGVPAKQIYKQVHFEPFSRHLAGDRESSGDIMVLFDYNSRNPVSGHYRNIVVDTF